MKPVDIGRLLDEGNWGGYQKWLIFLTALTIVFDGIDNQLLGVAIPSIMGEWSAPRSAFAPVVSLGYAGMMVGGAAAGLAGDRLGPPFGAARQHGAVRPDDGRRRRGRQSSTTRCPALPGRHRPRRRHS